MERPGPPAVGRRPRRERLKRWRPPMTVCPCAPGRTRPESDRRRPAGQKRVRASSGYAAPLRAPAVAVIPERPKMVGSLRWGATGGHVPDREGAATTLPAVRGPPPGCYSPSSAARPLPRPPRHGADPRNPLRIGPAVRPAPRPWDQAAAPRPRERPDRHGHAPGVWPQAAHNTCPRATLGNSLPCPAGPGRGRRRLADTSLARHVAK